jgi:mannitol/fructose-specific phosphotransferase system IIA component (Ntr-type)
MGIMERIKHMISAQKSQAPESSVATKALCVSDFLTEKNILFFPSPHTKPYLFEALIGSMKLDDPALALKEVLYRELWGRTVLAPGLALPHARIAGMTRITAALGICPTGVADASAADKNKSQIILLFLGPTSDVQKHLAFLAAVSSLFQTNGLAERLVQLATPASVFAQIRAAEGAL